MIRMMCLGVGLLASAAMFRAGYPSDPSPFQVVRFEDRFDGGLDGWDVVGGDAVSIQDVGGPAHGRVMVLEPNGWDVFALVRDSERWGNVRIDGEMLFPGEDHSYLGLLYHAQRADGRVDFGNIYVKGNDSYIRVNPHRDGNVGRTLYEEFRTSLTGPAAVRVGQWQRFRLEVAEHEAHLYVGDLARPQVMFPYYEHDSGRVGVQPRSVGGPVWVDNIRVTTIDSLSWTGSAIPGRSRYRPADLLVNWQVVGPLAAHDDGIARNPDDRRWRPAVVDGRGAVITAATTDYAGSRTVAYFRADVDAAAAGPMRLHLSSVDDLVVWLNGRFQGFFGRGPLAWFDFWQVSDHAGRTIPLAVRSGRNTLVVRVRGGQYATGGFFARLEAESARVD